MVLGPTLLAVAAVAILVFLFIQLKNFRIISTLLILLVVVSYFGFVSHAQDQGVELDDVNSIAMAGKIYFNWLGGVFNNVKAITGEASKMNWTVENESLKNLTKNNSG